MDVPIVAAASPFGAAYHITVQMVGGMETGPNDPVAGRYFLVRCGASSLEERLQNWQMYLRKPLFVAAVRAGGDAGMSGRCTFPMRSRRGTNGCSACPSARSST
ncbi:MAG: hypothetical protein R2851_06995 [Caldilineaceae bacterium]